MGFQVRRRRMGALVAAGLLVVVVAAGCGADDDDSSGSVGPSTVPSVTDEGSGATPALPAGVALAASTTAERAPAAQDAPVRELVAGWNDAGFDLLRAQPAGENVVFSPASIGHAVLMAEGAADHATRSAIAAAFDLPAGAHDAWNRLDQELAASQSDQITVTIADRIWPRLDISPDQAWIDLLASRHGAEVVPLDLSGDPDSSRDHINDWVAERTKDLIPELLPDGFIEPDTALVVTDTLSFNGDWAQPFGKYGPVDGTFTTVDGEAVSTSFMRELELRDRRGTGDGFVGAEIPYAAGAYSMLVLVPDEGRYEDVLARLDQQLLDEIDATFTTGPYELLLPKWDDTYQLDLLPWLSSLSIAPGSYPAISPDAYLDAAVHAADITVDEYGTVAAAATGLGFLTSGPPEPDLTVAADKPFLYLIRHRPTGLVLFTGHVTNPN